MAKLNPDLQTFANILVIGVGGSGNNAVSRMIVSKIDGVKFVAVNTDAQDLHHSNSPTKINVGKNLTRGLGAGMNPEVGRQAAEENIDEIKDVLKGADMVFVTGGFGGGTCTGAAPIVAKAAKESGALTVAVVTRPFSFEGQLRARIAEEGLNNLKEHVDAMVIINNDRLLNIIDRKMTLVEAFEEVDDVLRQGVQGISDLVVQPGIVNVDFADINAVMRDAGSAMMGVGRASGEDRAMEAARIAINSPLLDTSIAGAHGILFSVAGGDDLAMSEINDAAKIITDEINPEAKVIFGAYNDGRLKKGELKVTVIATGFTDSPAALTEELNFSVINGNGNSENERVAVTASVKTKNGNNDKKEEDDWDIPAFIRKKMK